MNIQKGANEGDSYKSLLLLDEISKGHPITQRDLSDRLGIALGLINSYIKNLISKGYITVTSIPQNRYRYFITPKGFAEKSRLTYHHLQNFTNLYKVARRDFQRLFYNLEKDGIKKVIFCGVDEVAEIAYLSLREVSIKLIAVMDDEKLGERFFEYKISPINIIQRFPKEPIIITKFRGQEIYKKLVDMGINKERIFHSSRV